MNFAQRSKAQNVKLELSWYPQRTCWRKKFKGRAYYFQQPITQDGYLTALHEWVLLKARLDGDRPHADLWQHHRELFLQVQRYWQQFGLPTEESKTARQVDEFLVWIEDWLEQPVLPSPMPVFAFCNSKKRKDFYAEFVGDSFTLFGTNVQYCLPAKWEDRLDRLTAKRHVKEPQTIGYWLDKYIERVRKRGGKFIRKRTASDRDFKLRHFKKYADMSAHVTSVDEPFVEAYHGILDTAQRKNAKELSRDSKEGYFKAFRMFVRWAASQSSCEMKLPANLDNREQSFREAKGTGRIRQTKKSMLWTAEEFKTAIAILPSPYDCFALLMMNCGFRHVDISELRHDDLQLDAGRIVIQRNKLNQQHTAPVVSYKLWEPTITAIRRAMSDHQEYVFTNDRGLQVENSIKVWWKRHKHKYGGKRLDYIRKTGSTLIAQFDRNLDELYLGESLGTTARIHYSFNDGEPCEALDKGLAALGSRFGLSEGPAKSVMLTDEMVEALQAAGIEI